MPALTRRRSDNPHRKTWHVYYGDVRVGLIGERAGVPSTETNGNGHADSTPVFIRASTDTVQGRRSKRRLPASAPIGKPSCLRYPTAPLRNTGKTEKPGPR